MIVGGQSVIQVENLLKSLGTAVQQSTRVLDDTGMYYFVLFRVIKTQQSVL
jgi:hypothetical protein